MATPNLGIPHISAADTGKYAKINTALTDFDGAYAGHIAVPHDPSTAFALFSTSYLGYLIFIFTGTLSGDVAITVPSHARPFIVVNATSGPPSVTYNLIFSVGASAVTATVGVDGLGHVLYCDGADSVYKVS